MSQELLGILLGMNDDHAEAREVYQRAPFGWPGGKSESIKHILPQLPYRDVWCEAFGGSGIVTLNRRKSRVLDVYNDRYGGLVTFYRCLRNPELRNKLIELIQLTPHAREEFVWAKETWENCEDDLERAYRWYVMIQQSFSGLGRNFARSTNSKAPIKIQSAIPYFNAIGSRFGEVQVENLDWKQCLQDYDSPETVFYLDPPYYQSDVGIYKHKFNRHEHHVELLESIFKCQGFVALSGYANDLYDSYKWSDRITWEVSVTMKASAFVPENHQVQTNHNINKKRAMEVLWIKK